MVDICLIEPKYHCLLSVSEEFNYYFNLCNSGGSFEEYHEDCDSTPIIAELISWIRFRVEQVERRRGSGHRIWKWEEKVCRQAETKVLPKLRSLSMTAAIEFH